MSTRRTEKNVITTETGTEKNFSCRRKQYNKDYECKLGQYNTQGKRQIQEVRHEVLYLTMMNENSK